MDYEGRICRPAYEKGAFKLSISVGCSYNQCKFCGLFKDLNFKIIDDKIVFDEIDWWYDCKIIIVRVILVIKSPWGERINYGRKN